MIQVATPARAPAPSGAAGAPPTAGPDGPRTAPRLLQLGQLLGEWEADARAAFDARTEGHPPRSRLRPAPRSTRRWAGCSSPACTSSTAGRASGRRPSPCRWPARAAFPALYVTAEMRPLELLRRITARVTGTYLGGSRAASWRRRTRWPRRGRRSPPCPGWPWPTPATPSPRRSGCARRPWPCAGTRATCWWRSTPSTAGARRATSASTEYDRLNAAIGALRALAGQLGCPVLGIAERNRASMAGGGLSAAAGSRKFEYAAESVLDLSVDEKGGAGAGRGRDGGRAARGQEPQRGGRASASGWPSTAPCSASPTWSARDA